MVDSVLLLYDIVVFLLIWIPLVCKPIDVRFYDLERLGDRLSRKKNLLYMLPGWAYVIIWLVMMIFDTAAGVLYLHSSYSATPNGYFQAIFILFLVGIFFIHFFDILLFRYYLWWAAVIAIFIAFLAVGGSATVMAFQGGSWMLWFAMGLEFGVTAIVILNVILAIIWAIRYKGDKVTPNAPGAGLVRPAHMLGGEHQQ